MARFNLLYLKNKWNSSRCFLRSRFLFMSSESYSNFPGGVFLMNDALQRALNLGPVISYSL
jgi:hypothetical protein